MSGLDYPDNVGQDARGTIKIHIRTRGTGTGDESGSIVIDPSQVPTLVKWLEEAVAELNHKANPAVFGLEFLKHPARD